MKIRIDTTVHMPEVPKEVEIDGGTLGDLIEKLLAGIPAAGEIIDSRTGELRLEGLFEVSLNNVAHNSLPAGLATPLRDGDAVTLALVLIGGG